MRWAIGLPVVAMAAAAWLSWTSWPSAPLPPAPAPTAVPAIAAPADAPALPASLASPRSRGGDSPLWSDRLEQGLEPPSLAADDDPSAVVLRGRLTVRQRPWVHPAGVEIRLTRTWLDTVVPIEVPDDTRRDPVTRTGPDGSFAFRFRPLAGELFFLIDRGGVWLDFQKVPRVPATGSTLDLGDVYVDDRGGVRGRVLSTWGRPHAGVTVRAVDSALLDISSGLADLRAARTDGTEHFDPAGTTGWGALPQWVARRDQLLPFPTATSDRDGVFELGGLRPGTHDLIFRMANGGTVRSSVQVAAPRITEIGNVTLVVDRSIVLRFVDEHDAPWIGASVTVIDERVGYGAEMVRTRADGEAWLTASDPTTSRVLFSHPGGGPCLDLGCLAHLDDPDASTWTRPKVRVRRLPELRVALIDPAGAAVSGARVRFYTTGVQFRPVDRRLPDWMQPTEREPGTYVGKGLPGTVVVASAPGFAPAMAMPARHQDPLLMVPLQWTTVFVHDLEGQPVAGATVRLQVHQHPDLQWPGAQWELLADDRARVGSTDALGRLDVPIWGTWFSFEVSHPDYATTAGPRVLPRPGVPIDLVLHRPGGIEGTLRAQYRPVAGGFRVRARQRPPGGNRLDGSGFLADYRAVTAADGSFAFRHLAAGLWELQPEFPATPGVHGAARSASPFASCQILLGDGQTTHCTLEASRLQLTTPQLAGIVRTNGLPRAGILVRVRPLAPAPARNKRGRETGMPAPPPWLQQCTTDSFGDFDFAGLEPAREYEVRFDLPQDGRLQLLRCEAAVTPADPNAPPTRIAAEFATGSLVLQCNHGAQPFGNRMVRIRRLVDPGPDAASFELLTDANGSVQSDDLPAGEWTLEPVHGGHLAPERVEIHGSAITRTTVDWRP